MHDPSSTPNEVPEAEEELHWSTAAIKKHKDQIVHQHIQAQLQREASTKQLADRLHGYLTEMGVPVGDLDEPSVEIDGFRFELAGHYSHGSYVRRLTISTPVPFASGEDEEKLAETDDDAWGYRAEVKVWEDDFGGNAAYPAKLGKMLDALLDKIDEQEQRNGEASINYERDQDRRKYEANLPDVPEPEDVSALARPKVELLHDDLHTPQGRRRLANQIEELLNGGYEINSWKAADLTFEDGEWSRDGFFIMVRQPDIMAVNRARWAKMDEAKVAGTQMDPDVERSAMWWGDGRRGDAEADKS